MIVRKLVPNKEAKLNGLIIFIIIYYLQVKKHIMKHSITLKSKSLKFQVDSSPNSLKNINCFRLLLRVCEIPAIRARSHLATATQIFDVVSISSEMDCIVTNVTVRTRRQKNHIVVVKCEWTPSCF